MSANGMGLLFLSVGTFWNRAWWLLTLCAQAWAPAAPCPATPVPMLCPVLCQELWLHWKAGPSLPPPSRGTRTRLAQGLLASQLHRPYCGCLAPASQSCRANVTVPSLPCAGHTRHSLCPANCFLHVPLTTVRVWGEEMIGLCCACLPVCWLPLLFHWERVLPRGLSSSLHLEMCGHV